MKLIFIVGKKRSGKDTAVKFIKENFKADEYKLAAPIKEALSCAWDELYVSRDTNIKLTMEDWDGDGVDREIGLPLNNFDVRDIMAEAILYLCDTYPHIDIGDHDNINAAIETVIMSNKKAWSIRRMMQTLGTDIVVNHLSRNYWMDLFIDKYNKTNTDDIDFFIVPDTRQDHELTCARNLSAAVIHVHRPENDATADSHITEAGLPVRPGDYVIINDDSLDSLKHKITEVVKSL